MTDPVPGGATETTGEQPGERNAPATGRGALLVGTGIFFSRIFGFARSKCQAQFLGLDSTASDAFALALRLPNFLQNLLGEGVLSASFIPAYATLTARGEQERASRLAGAVFSLLALTMSVFVLLGVVLAPVLVRFFMAQHDESAQALATTIVRIMFPGTGVLVLSAWCLAVLNSHRRFLLSYSAPVLWNVAIVALIIFGATRSSVEEEIVLWAAWGAVLGSCLQFLVQLPLVLSLARGISWSPRAARTDVRNVVSRFLPAVTARGSVQMSGYIDTWLVGRIPSLGTFAGLGFAQMLYQLPISLFGMAVSAAELPDISATTGGAVARNSRGAEILRARLGAATRRTMFFVLPSAIALGLFGDRIISLIYLGGKFDADDVTATWVILLGFSLGIVPATLSRLVATSFFAMHDTATPLRYAVMRIVFGAVTAALLLFVAPQLMPQGFFEGREIWRVAGLSIAGSLAFWLEYKLLRGAFVRLLGPPEARGGFLARLVASALIASLAGLAVGQALGDLTSRWESVAVIGAFGTVYLLLTMLLGVFDPGSFGKLLRRR